MSFIYTWKSFPITVTKFLFSYFGCNCNIICFSSSTEFPQTSKVSIQVADHRWIKNCFKEVRPFRTLALWWLVCWRISFNVNPFLLTAKPAFSDAILCSGRTIALDFISVFVAFFGGGNFLPIFRLYFCESKFNDSWLHSQGILKIEPFYQQLGIQKIKELPIITLKSTPRLFVFFEWDWDLGFTIAHFLQPCFPPKFKKKSQCCCGSTLNCT